MAGPKTGDYCCTTLLSLPPLSSPLLDLASTDPEVDHDPEDRSGEQGPASMKQDNITDFSSLLPLPLPLDLGSILDTDFPFQPTFEEQSTENGGTGNENMLLTMGDCSSTDTFPPSLPFHVASSSMQFHPSFKEQETDTCKPVEHSTPPNVNGFYSHSSYAPDIGLSSQSHSRNSVPSSSTSSNPLSQHISSREQRVYPDFTSSLNTGAPFQSRPKEQGVEKSTSIERIPSSANLLPLPLPLPLSFANSIDTDVLSQLLSHSNSENSETSAALAECKTLPVAGSDSLLHTLDSRLSAQPQSSNGALACSDPKALHWVHESTEQEDIPKELCDITDSLLPLKLPDVDLPSQGVSWPTHNKTTNNSVFDPSLPLPIPLCVHLPLDLPSPQGFSTPPPNTDTLTDPLPIQSTLLQTVTTLASSTSPLHFEQKFVEEVACQTSFQSEETAACDVDSSSSSSSFKDEKVHPTRDKKQLAKERKREKKKLSAILYRKKKKEEKSDIEKRCEQLMATNAQLKEQVSDLTSEIANLKNVLEKTKESKRKKTCSFIFFPSKQNLSSTRPQP